MGTRNRAEKKEIVQMCLSAMMLNLSKLPLRLMLQSLLMCQELPKERLLLKPWQGPQPQLMALQQRPKQTRRNLRSLLQLKLNQRGRPADDDGCFFERRRLNHSQ